MSQETQPNVSLEEEKIKKDLEAARAQEKTNPQKEEEKAASPEEIEKAKQEVQEVIDEAIQIKTRTEELTEHVKGLISRLGQIQGNLDRRDLTTKAIEPLLEQTMPWFKNQMLVIQEKSQELVSKQKNFQEEMNESPNNAREIIKRAQAAREEAVGEIARTIKGMENYAADSFRVSAGIVRRTEEYLGEPLDKESNVSQVAANMRLIQNEASSSRIRSNV